MYIYLVQHAKAKSVEQDPERGLSNEGTEDMIRVSGLLSLFTHPTPAHILHSGKPRAQQTAEILAQRLQINVVQEAPDLKPNADPTVWAAHLSETHEDMMLVGHLPHMERLASLLLCGDMMQHVVSFTQAAVLCLQRDAEGQYSICWMLTPQLL